jgi:hypothetical protein
MESLIYTMGEAELGIYRTRHGYSGLLPTPESSVIFKY